MSPSRISTSFETAPAGFATSTHAEAQQGIGPGCEFSVANQRTEAMAVPKIKHIRASTVRGGGGDYHDQSGYHWIDDHIATPMARYPEYRQSRRSFGINVLGTLVGEVEADDGTVGLASTR